MTNGAKRYSRPPAHQNDFAFRHNPKSKLTAKIMALPSSDRLCPSCRCLLEWRKKYRKYRMLKAPRKCVKCNNKTVKAAYHARCDVCAAAERVCAKCGDPREYDTRKHPELVSMPPPPDFEEDGQSLSSNDDCETTDDVADSDSETEV